MDQFTSKNVLILNNQPISDARKLPEWSQSHALCYVLNGTKRLSGIDGPMTLHKGAVVFIQKDACITEYYEEEQVSLLVFFIRDAYIISFVNEYLRGRQAGASLHRSIMTVNEDGSIDNICLSVAQWLDREQPLPQAILDLRFRELLLNILIDQENNALLDFFLTRRRESTSPMHEIMEANYYRNLTLEEYARLTNRSVSSFKRDFQSVYQTSPGRWLMEKKLARAKCLLLQNNMPVSEVAYESGFENTAHFSRLFRQKTGCSPIGFRRNHMRKEVVAV